MFPFLPQAISIKHHVSCAVRDHVLTSLLSSTLHIPDLISSLVLVSGDPELFLRHSLCSGSIIPTTPKIGSCAGTAFRAPECPENIHLGMHTLGPGMSCKVLTMTKARDIIIPLLLVFRMRRSAEVLA